jgi:1-hydroxycarotenoid 3,4-desaturase
LTASKKQVVVIGAGIGGLAAALRLAHAGCAVTVVERAAMPGGKLRTLPSVAGPVDTGPTVLTLRPVFDRLFSDVGERLEDHLTLTRQTLLARHYWSDGTVLDLDADPDKSAGNVEAAFGAKARSEFESFSNRAKMLFDGFDQPMMQAAEPSLGGLARHVLHNPSLIPAMAPLKTLAGMLNSHFSDGRLAQLFGRYATYVGGSPYQSPAILALIWHAEAQGVWTIKGGMHQLARAIETLARRKGVTFHYNVDVKRIESQGGRAAYVTARDMRLPADVVIFNGDPQALVKGAMGHTAQKSVPATATSPRSLSACVYAFAAEAQGPELAHHTVFFGDSPRAEFDALAAGQLPDDPSLYICAQDRGTDHAPPQTERFEIILNAPPTTQPTDAGDATCHPLIFNRLRQFGLTFSPTPLEQTLSTPQAFQRLFPYSDGALYGLSPHGMMAAFARPTARTTMPGLYLTGGGAHPGAGLPMATLSAQHAAEAILSDLTLTSTSPQTAMHGGMSTV